MCSTLEVTRSGYYRYEKTPEIDKNMGIVLEIKSLHTKTRGSYGSRRIAKFLQKKEYKIGRFKVRNLMRKLGLVCKQRRRYKITTKTDEKRPVAKNVLDRNFAVAELNRVWAADITYIPTQEGWLYLAAVLDICSRRVIGWALANHMRESLVEDALAMAMGRRSSPKNVLHHSDRGSQYTSSAYQIALQKVSATVSMSRKGNCWDNAVMERFFGSLKSERTDHQKYITRVQAKADIIDYIEMFYNSHRLHSTLGYLSPLAYENKKDSSKVSTFT